MVNPNRFYTYAYLREDRTPYYIGKGCGNRIYSNYGRPCIKPKDKSRIIFLKQNLIEEESFKHEKYMIAVFGRKDLGTGILHNKTDGGDGASGLVHNEESRKRISEAMKGENHPHYGKRGKDSPNYGKVPSEEHRRKISQSKLGKLCSEETRKRMSESKKGVPQSDETKKRISEGMKGENNHQYGKKGKDSPNYGKSPSEETRRKQSEVKKKLGLKPPSPKGKKWWNDGKGNTKMSIECPGEGWVSGREMKWWNDGKGNTKMSIKCPGEGWGSGR